MADQTTTNPADENDTPLAQAESTETTPEASVNAAALGTTEAQEDSTPETVLDEPADESLSVNAASLAAAEESSEPAAEATPEATEESAPAAESSEAAPAEATEETTPVAESSEPVAEESAPAAESSEATDEVPAIASEAVAEEAAADESNETTGENLNNESAVATPAAEASADEGEGEGKSKRKRGKKGGRKGRKLESFAPGEEIQGTVRSVQPYGAFVDVGAERDGLVHISELRDGFVEKVEDVVKEGDQVTVRVKDVDVEKGRLSLTMRSEQSVAQDQEQEKRLRLKDLSEGQEILGRVNSIVDFGAFVDIGATTDGLIHISELSEDRVNRVSDVVSEGEEVKVRILSIDRKRNRISLTMREHVAVEDYSFEDEDQEEMPSMMELAFQRAQERNKKKGKRAGKREKGASDADPMDDIIARTLRQHQD